MHDGIATLYTGGLVRFLSLLLIRDDVAVVMNMYTVSQKKRQ